LRTEKNSSAAQKLNYVESINRVLDHIGNDLTRPLPLTELAELANLSPFHFHRVFQAMIGETPNEYVKRLRLEKSLQLMSFGKGKRLTAIAIECGFSSSSDFTRSFKQKYGTAPSKFDIASWRAEHGEQLEGSSEPYIVKLKNAPSRANPDQFRVRIRELPARMVAYIRVLNPYAGDQVAQAAKRLVTWADTRGYGDGQWLGYQFEDPQITPLENCQYFLGVQVEQEFTPKGEIGLYHFPAMLVAEIEMKGGIELELRLLQWLYGSWLPRSNYVPADQPCFEAWIGKPFEHGFEHFELAIQLPIK
jgi:AraC family transcriptional regulator